MKFAPRSVLRWSAACLGTGFLAFGPAEADEFRPSASGPTTLRLIRQEKAAIKKDDDKDKKNGDEKKEDAKPSWKAWAPEGQLLTLTQCLQAGLERQPAIHAARASLAQSEIGHVALYGLRPLAVRFTPDLEIRKRQSQRGITAGSAGVLIAQHENTYDVARLYYTYIYATQQEQTAADIVEQMEAFYDSAVEFLKLEVPDPKVKLNEFTLGALDGIIGEVRELRDKASVGRRKALAALKEAMGVEREFLFVPADKELPLMAGSVTEDTVVALALARRPELVQAAVVVDVTRLEVCAQQLQTRSQKADTFASGTDLHARVLPTPVRNGEYRPGAVPPEMPSQLIGTVSDRVARATELVKRQEAAYAKAVGLVRLEATNAFLNWQSAVERVTDARDRHERAQKLVEKSRAAAATKMDPELLVRNESLASKAQAQYVQAVFDQILALIALEKVTGGGVVPAFPGR